MMKIAAAYRPILNHCFPHVVLFNQLKLCETLTRAATFKK